MKILVIHFGGTIACAEKQGRLSPVADIRKYFKQINKETGNVCFIHKRCKPFLSEQLNSARLNYVIRTVKEAVTCGDYDGIIVTHGSDTSAYTSAALGYALGNECIPTVLVYADRPLSDGNSSGHISLRAATAVILSGEACGVFSISVKDKNEARVIRAARSIRQSAYESELRTAGEVYGTVALNAPEKPLFVKNPNYSECADELSPFEVSLGRICPVSVMTVYPSAVYQAPPRKCRAVILSTYHSGTLDTESRSLLRLARTCKRRQIPIFADASNGGTEYESEGAFSDLGIRRLPPLASPDAMLIKLWLILSANGDLNMLRLSLSGDIVKQKHDTGCV